MLKLTPCTGELSVARQTLNGHKNELNNHKIELEQLQKRLQESLQALDAKG